MISKLKHSHPFSLAVTFILLCFLSTNCSRNGHPSGEKAGGLTSDTSSVPLGAKLAKVGVVVHKGDAKAWDGGMVDAPVVWYDSANGRYGIVYTGYELVNPQKRAYAAVSNAQIGLAWSKDLIHWTKDPDNPIFGPSHVQGTPDESGTTGPFMWYEDGTYYLFYIGLTHTGYEGGRKTLDVATSTDLKHWTRYKDNPIIVSGGDGWRKDAIWHPDIVKVDGTYYLFFNATGVVNGKTEERIGYATSKDLFHWTVDDQHSPLLSGSGKPGSWEASGRAGNPCVYKIGATWYMAYYSWDGKHMRDGLATTTEQDFPLGWKKYAGNPVLDIGPPGSYDAIHAGEPSIYITKDRYYHFYTAVDTSRNRDAALAVWPPLK